MGLQFTTKKREKNLIADFPPVPYTSPGLHVKLSMGVQHQLVSPLAKPRDATRADKLSSAPQVPPSFNDHAGQLINLNDQRDAIFPVLSELA